MMSKGAEIDYESYAKSMREVLSGNEIRLSDNTLNHQYFNAKKGFYWSDDNEQSLINGIKKYGKDWKTISTSIFQNAKSEVELEMRACLLFKVKDVSEINEKQIDAIEKKMNGIEASEPVSNGKKNSKK